VFDDRYNGLVGEHERVTQKTMLRFTWLLEADDFNEGCDVHLLCRYVMQRGVRVPGFWKAAAEAAAEFGFDYGREEEHEMGGDAAEKASGESGTNHDGAATKEPESEPEGEMDSELRRELWAATAKGVGFAAAEHSSDEEGSADDDALPATGAAIVPVRYDSRTTWTPFKGWTNTP